MVPKLYMFEGEMRTVAQANQICSRLSESKVRKNLQAGMTTIVEMLSVDPVRASAAGARKAIELRGKPRVLSIRINAERNR